MDGTSATLFIKGSSTLRIVCFPVAAIDFTPQIQKNRFLKPVREHIEQLQTSTCRCAGVSTSNRTRPQ